MTIAHALVLDPYKPQAFLLLIFLGLLSYFFFKIVCKNNSPLKNSLAAVACCIIMVGIYYIPNSLEFIFKSAWHGVVCVFIPLVFICLIASRQVGFLKKCLLTFLICLTFFVVFYSYVMFSVKSISCWRPEEQMRTNLASLSSTLELYKNDCGKYPEDLQWLVDANYLDRLDFFVMEENGKIRELTPNYIQLTSNAPIGLVYFWLTPPILFPSDKSEVAAPDCVYVLKHCQGFEKIKIAELEPEIQRTRKWLAEHTASTTQPSE